MQTDDDYYDYNYESSTFHLLISSHILSLPYSFLFVDDCPSPVGICSHCESVKCLYTLSEMLYFYDLQKPRTCGVPNQSWWDTRVELFKPIKPQLSHQNPDEMDSHSYPSQPHSKCSTPKIGGHCK